MQHPVLASSISLKMIPWGPLTAPAVSRCPHWVDHHLHCQHELDTRTCTPSPGHANLGQKSCRVQAERTPVWAGQGGNFGNGVRFSVQTRSAGSVAWHRLCLCSVGSRGRSSIGRNVRIGEVVCRVCHPAGRHAEQAFAVPSTTHQY